MENWLRASLAGALPGADLVILGAVMVLAALFLKRGVVGALVAFRGKLGR
jgi:branched-chain amino acid transport system permease protein